MAAPRFLNLVAGRVRQIVAVIVSNGAADGEKIVATKPDGTLDDSVLNAATSGAGKVLKTLPDGTIDPSTLPTGIGADVKNVTGSEALAENDLVNLWNDSGTVKARKADATAEGKEAHGFVKAASGANTTAAVYFEGRMSGLSGLTPGARMFVSAATAGASTATPPALAGNVVQHIGTAVSATEIDFEKGEPVTLA